MYCLRKRDLISRELWFRFLLGFFIFVCPSFLLSDSGDLDFLFEESVNQKPTVCTLTINSMKEKEVFQSYLGDDFNFVELIQFASNREDWFIEACKSGVECDILVISGHFTGSFSGLSGYRLSLSELQSRACQEACSGLLKKPKEVFLFGSNTTAEKTKDYRTPEEYTRVLIADGFSRGQAEQISAFRYSSLGEQTQDRMKQVFSHSRIYGFHSLAPRGENIMPRLKKYFKSIKDYSVHLSQFPSSKENKKWSSAMKGLSIRSIDGGKNPTCVLEEDKPLYKKLLWIDEVLSDEEKSLAYIPVIDIFLRGLKQRFGSLELLPPEELSLLESIQFNEEARSNVDELLEGPIGGMLSSQVNVLKFGGRVGWYDREKYKQKLKVLIGDIFKKNLDLDEKELICSLGAQMDLSLEDLPKERWNEYTIKALGCVRPASSEVHLALVEALKDPSAKVRSSAVLALGEIKPKSSEVHLALVEALKDPSADARASTAWALGEIKPKSSEVHLALAEALKDPSVQVRVSAVWALGKIKPESIEIHLALAKALEDPSERVRASAAGALGEIKSAFSEVHLALAKALEDPSAWVRSSAAGALGKIKPKSSEVHLALAKVLKEDPSERVRASAAGALGEIKSAFSEIHLALVKALEDPSAWVRSSAVRALGEIKPESSEIHLALAKTLEDPDVWVRFYTAEALGKIKPGSSEVRLALAKSLEDPSAWVRAATAWALGEIKPESSEIHLDLAKALEDPSVRVRVAAAEALGKIKPESSEALLALAKALEDPSERVRASAAEALNHINSD